MVRVFRLHHIPEIPSLSSYFTRRGAWRTYAVLHIWGDLKPSLSIDPFGNLLPDSDALSVIFTEDYLPSVLRAIRQIDYLLASLEGVRQKVRTASNMRDYIFSTDWELQQPSVVLYPLSRTHRLVLDKLVSTFLRDSVREGSFYAWIGFGDPRRKNTPYIWGRMTFHIKFPVSLFSDDNPRFPVRWKGYLQERPPNSNPKEYPELIDYKFFPDFTELSYEDVVRTINALIYYLGQILNC